MRKQISVASKSPVPRTGTTDRCVEVTYFGVGICFAEPLGHKCAVRGLLHVGGTCSIGYRPSEITDSQFFLVCKLEFRIT